MRALVLAMGRFEQGVELPYSENQIKDALDSAGIHNVPKSPVAAFPETAGGIVAGIGTAATATVAVVQQVQETASRFAVARRACALRHRLPAEDRGRLRAHDRGRRPRCDLGALRPEAKGPLMPPWLLGLVNRPWFVRAVAILAAIGGLIAAVFKLIGIGRDQQKAKDLKTTADILEKQRDEAARPVDPGVARDRLRSGKR